MSCSLRGIWNLFVQGTRYSCEVSHLPFFLPVTLLLSVFEPVLCSLSFLSSHVVTSFGSPVLG